MKRAMAAVVLLALAGCAKGTIEDYKWTVECPPSVDKGTEFKLLVNTRKAGDEAEGDSVGGVPYHYQIHCTG